MKEPVARAVLLVKAIEEADTQYEVLTEDDRKYASRAARELAQWQESEGRAHSSFESFLSHRAEQLLKRLAQRHKLFQPLARSGKGLGRLPLLLPALALFLGFAIERIANPHRVDLLSAPLLLILLWNAVTYFVLLALTLVPARGPGLRRAMVERVAHGGARLPRRLPHAMAKGALLFMQEWTRLTGRLNAARVARVLHWSSAAFALGAIAALYMQGVLARYGAGWESTFLDASQVHALLSMLFAPVIAVFHLQGFSLADVAALQFEDDGIASAGVPGGGARWVHLYAGCLLLYVVLPRMALGMLAGLRARWMAGHVQVGLDQPYFRRLAQQAGAAPGLLRVLPYSFAVDELRSKALERVAVSLLGDEARLRILPLTAYGGVAPVLAPEADAVTAVLFSMAATPEQENHGAFLAAVQKASGALTVLLDQSILTGRLDPQRQQERVELWRSFCAAYGATPQVVDLLATPAQARLS